MAFVHADSCECLKSELDLFNVPPTQTSVETGTFVEYHPITNIRDGSPLEFDVQGTGSDYIDLANCLLYVKAKVTQANDADLAANTQVAPVNLFLHSGGVAEWNTDCISDEHIPVSGLSGESAVVRSRRKVYAFDVCLVLQRHCR